MHSWIVQMMILLFLFFGVCPLVGLSHSARNFSHRINPVERDDSEGQDKLGSIHWSGSTIILRHKNVFSEKQDKCDSSRNLSTFMPYLY